MRLNARSSVPLYLQLRNILLKRINTGELSPHERLPSERELVQQFGISRMTVRRTLQDLVQEGILYTRVGKGTFVSNVHFEQNHVLTGFTEEMQRLRQDVSSQVLEFIIIPAANHLDEELGVSPGAALYRLKRVRFANGIPMALETAHIPQSLCPGLEAHDFSHESLYEVLRSKYGLRLINAQQTIVATLADERERRLFKIKHPAAVLRMKRRTWTDRNLIAEYVESVYRGDLYNLRVRLSAE